MARKRFWTAKQASEALKELKGSELGSEIGPIERYHNEWNRLTTEIAALEAERRVIEEAGKLEIKAYGLARYKLLLKRIHEAGKVYCDYGDHVVDEVAVRLLFNHNCGAMYYIHHICSQCIHEIETGTSGNTCEFQEMREENGTRLWFKNDEWRPLPERLVDYTDENKEGWISPEVAKEYNLPIAFHSDEFPPDLSDLYRD